MITAVDYPTARAAERAGVDAILVGDSLAMVVLGYDSTLPVTLDEMLHHARAVHRGARRPLLIGDLPFMSYQTGPQTAVASAGRFVKEAGMEAVKLEGGRAMVPMVRAIVEAGIPVMGHVGLTPQSVHVLGGYRVQGRTREAANRVLDDAAALAEAGCFAIVLEGVPAPLAEFVTASLDVPTIGIGAGPGVDGQVLVLHDVIGWYDGNTPRFVKRYAEVGPTIESAIRAYVEDVGQRCFPEAAHSYAIGDDEWSAFVAGHGPETIDAASRRDVDPEKVEA